MSGPLGDPFKGVADVLADFPRFVVWLVVFGISVGGALGALIVWVAMR